MKELAVPAARRLQLESHCGPGALLLCLRYLGVAGRATERSLGREMGTTAKMGTDVEAMIAAAQKRTSRAEFVEGLSIEELGRLVDAGCLCILLLQAWSDDPRPNYWTDENGHYVVVTAISRGRVYFADPSLPRVRASLKHQELRDRWHEQETNRRVHCGAIVIEGPTPRWRKLGPWKRMG